MPIHALQDLRSLVVEDAWELATLRCRRDVQSLGMVRSDVQDLLLAIAQHDHTAELGRQESDFGAIEADAYRIWYDADARMRCSPHNAECFRVKLGIQAADDGGRRVIVFLHRERRP